MRVRPEAAAAVAVAGEQCILPEDAEELEQRLSFCYTQLGLSGTVEIRVVFAPYDTVVCVDRADWVEGNE